VLRGNSRARKLRPRAVRLIAQVEGQMADHVLVLAVLFVGQPEIQMRISQSGSNFNSAHEMLYGVFNFPQLLENASEIEFRKRVFRFQFHSD